MLGKETICTMMLQGDFQINDSSDASVQRGGEVLKMTMHPQFKVNRFITPKRN